jgi:branched-chain amino acid transport system ATP-binding protein
MLKVSDLVVAYGEFIALHGVNLQVNEGEIVAVLGSNGAGKTTLLKTIAGLLKPRHGTILHGEEDITRYSAHQIVNEFGIVYTPEGAPVFPYLTVRENLELAKNVKRGREKFDEQLEIVYNLFPILKEREKQRAGTLSGGERQMLNIARSLMLLPRILMLDEPSFGLAPIVVTRIFDAIKRINEELRITVLLVEQNVKKSLEIADRGYVLEAGRVVLQGTGSDLLTSELVREAYLGI